jgi:heme/copper-type cytochrome/quinol oxidase subunit 4
MVTGMLAALTLPVALPKLAFAQAMTTRFAVNFNVAIVFPIVFLISLAGSLAGTFFTEPDDMRVLMDFYRSARPWGFWGPVAEQVAAEDPSFVHNTDFWRDVFNIVVGMVWQVALVALPMYVVIREFYRAAIALAIVLATSFILKFSWFDHLAEREVSSETAPPAALSSAPDQSQACYNKR